MCAKRENIRSFCRDVINRQNKSVCDDIIQNVQDSVLSSIDMKTLSLNQETFSRDLTNICDILFSMRRPTPSYIIVVLSFSIELNDYCLIHYSWYVPELLLQTLTDVFVRIGFDPEDMIFPKYNCIIL